MEETSISTEVSTVSTEVAPSSAPAMEVSNSPDVSGAYSSSPSVDSGKSTSESSTPAVYTPNYEVLAYGNKYEIPKEYQGFINESNEKEFKQLFSKAFAADELLNKNNKIREHNANLEKEIKEKYLPVYKGLDVVNKYLANQDFGSFFEMLKIPVEQVQAWMLKELQMKDLPPEQQQLYTTTSKTQKQLYQLEQINEQQRLELEAIKEASTNALVQQRTNELNTILNRSDVKAVADRFDTQQNQVGAFRDEVINRAKFLYQTKGQDLSAEQAVEEFMKLIMANAPSASPNNTVIAPKSGTKAPTLPNLAGQTTGPAAQKVKSMADLQALKKQAIASMSQNN